MLDSTPSPNTIYTGYEVYNIASGQESDKYGKIDIDLSIQTIQDAMFARNPEKYGDFLETLNATRDALYGMYHPVQYFRYLFSKKAEEKSKLKLSIKIPKDEIIETQLELFRCVYYAMRLIDDVVDGDTQMPLTLDERKKLLDSILTGNIEEIENPLYKTLALKIKELSRKLGKEEEMHTAILEIIHSMKFDLERIMDNDKNRTREDLDKNFHKMDITGTIAGTAIIFGIDTENSVELLTPLGEACRIMYNLRDFGEDIIADLINISEEDLVNFGITQEDLDVVKGKGKAISFSELPANIKNWFLAEIERLNQEMMKHMTNMKQKFQFTDNPGRILSVWRNFVMKKLILPKAYTKEVDKRIPEIATQVT